MERRSLSFLRRTTPWYCLQTRPCNELLAKRLIEKLGFDVILPMTTKTRTIPRTNIKQEYQAPLLGNYMFVSFNVITDNWRMLWNVYGVKRIFSSTPDKPIPVPKEAIDSLFKCFDDPKSTTPHINPGSHVRITKGPFREIVGICDWSNDQRVALLIQMMQGTVKIEFNVDAIELTNETQDTQQPH